MLLVDVHEPKSLAAELHQGMPIKAITLKYGDYSFSGTIIERKSLSDFFSSLKSGRLLEQMENINRFYTNKYLLIEGFFDFEYVNNIEYLYNQLFRITHDFGVRIIFSKDEKQTAAFIRKLYFRRFLGSAIPVAKRSKIHCAANLFGISRRKLESIYIHFGSISNMAKADRNEFNKIKGIGNKTVDKLKDVLNSDIFNK